MNTRDLQVEEAGWTEDLEAWTARLRLPPVVHPKVPASEAGACDPSAGRAGADEPDASCASANKAGANGPTPREPSASKTSAIQTVPCEPRATEAVVSGSVPDPDADPDDGGAPIGPVQSLIVGRVATPETVDAWLALARRVTVRELREEVLKAREAGSSAPLLSGCAAPGCTSRRNLEEHHIDYRSRGGADEPGNLITLCRFHHQAGEHGGLLRCRGEAPLGILWWLGEQGKGGHFRNERRVHGGAG